MGTAVADIQSIRQDLARMDAEFEAVLPRGVRVEEFRRVTLNAIQENPRLINADRQSFFRACLDCARDGNVPDGKEAYFDIRSTRVKVRGQGEQWVDKVVYMPMIRGFYKRTIGKTLKDWRGDVVCENDHFELVKGDVESFIHRPDVFGDRGKIIGAYSIAVMLDGTISREFMNHRDLMKAKAKSTAGDGPNAPWNMWEDRMCIKTVAKRHSVRLPIGQEAQDLIDRDNEVQAIEATPAPKPAAVAGKRAAQQLADMSKPAANGHSEPQEYVPETEQEAGEAANEERRELTQAPAQRGQEARRRGPGRPTNEERQANRQAEAELMREAAQPAAAKAAPTDLRQSPQPSASSQRPAGQKATTTPSNGGATTVSYSEPERGSHISGDPVDDIGDPVREAFEQGKAAFLAEMPRKPPRELTAASRHGELNSWFDGYDQAEEEAERGEMAEADDYVDRVHS